MKGKSGIPRQADIAARAGVSQSAVSRAFGGGYIAASTREKVFEAASHFGYEPDAIARSLKTGQSNLVALVVGQMHNPFYPYVLDELTRRFTDQNRPVLLFTVARGGTVDEILPQALSYRIGGMVVASAELSSKVVDVCQEREIPLVLFNRYLPGSDAAGVQADNRAGGQLAAEHLLSTGRNRLAFVGGLGGTSTNLERYGGFRDALAGAGLELAMVIGNEYSYEWGVQAADRILSSNAAIDGVFCANDIIAIGLIDGLRAGGRRVPDDIAVVGFDDIPAAAWSAYDLTTVRQPVAEMIDATLQILDGPVSGDGEDPARLATLPTRLVIRGSSRAAVTDDPADAERPPS